MRVALFLLPALLVGCAYDFDAFDPSGVVDAAVDGDAAADAPAVDSSAADSGGIDTGARDTAPPPDTTVVDTGVVDTGPVDTGAADTAKPDTAVADTAKPDTMVTDAGPTDTAVADTATATPDAGAADTAPDTSAVACTEAGAKLVAGHCYFALPASNGDAAKSACEAKGAHLVTITSGGEETLVEGFSPGSDKWIGLRATMTSSMASAFKWVTGEPVGYTNWGGGQPNSSGLCVWVRGSSNNWSDRACTDTGVPVCERE